MSKLFEEKMPRVLEFCNEFDIQMVYYPDYIVNKYNVTFRHSDFDYEFSIRFTGNSVINQEEIIHKLKNIFCHSESKTKYPTIENVIFNYPATIVFWSDGDKTVVKCSEDDAFDVEKGLAMAVTKKFLGTNESKSNFNDIFEKWLPDEAPISLNDLGKCLVNGFNDGLKEAINTLKERITSCNM